MAMFERVLRSWRKRRAIAGYVRRLPRQLRRDYGPAESYTPAQIRASIDRARLDRTFSCYAESLYADAPSFAADHLARGEICDYEAMRAEMAETHLGGHALMTPGDALAAAEAAHPAGGASGHHGVGHGVGHGGDHGGFDGGSHGGS